MDFTSVYVDRQGMLHCVFTVDYGVYCLRANVTTIPPDFGEPVGWRIRCFDHSDHTTTLVAWSSSWSSRAFNLDIAEAANLAAMYIKNKDAVRPTLDTLFQGEDLTLPFEPAGGSGA